MQSGSDGSETPTVGTVLEQSLELDQPEKPVNQTMDDQVHMFDLFVLVIYICIYIYIYHVYMCGVAR